ncbi:hypothetical protein, partial [Flavobacterium subsaxonicum]|uniref:hypothetical protein n=1 Tax=Flavobacterium subsaxonicum TaxID=426226 RepID=UPI001A94A1EF
KFFVVFCWEVDLVGVLRVLEVRLGIIFALSKTTEKPLLMVFSTIVQDRYYTNLGYYLQTPYR